MTPGGKQAPCSQEDRRARRKGLPHHKGYASLFDVLHLERAIRTRLRPGRLAPGLVTRLEEAVMAALHVSLAQVQKCRKAISACLRGQRSRVAWLRPRNR